MGPVKNLSWTLAALATAPAGAAAAGLRMAFPHKQTDIQLDLVGLLTVIGEAAMAIHAQAVTGSRLCLLPRILPAPQAFLLPERRARLPRNLGVTNVSVAAGNIARDLNFLPNILLTPDAVRPFVVREVAISRRASRTADRIKPKLTGPTEVLSLLGLAVACGLLAFALQARDGMAVVALLLLALTSTLTGLGSLWVMVLQVRTEQREVPPGDVLVRGTQGSFILVRCDEAIARELFFGPESCGYVLEDEAWFRVLAGAGTFTLMAAVVCLANCTWELQAAIGLAYIVLNALYWLAAVLPPRYSWDLGMYEVKRLAEDKKTSSYMMALAEVVKRTKTVNWARESNMVPVTRAWDRWLQEAESDANQTESTWDPGARLTALIKEHM
ncbi:hypothetical protein EDC01DRAFT_116696 [Geopyxis carbonaria]|nr:hypothetical protein EDC01DRAFT_116696 [Geopyxis carbonaria]